MAVAFETIQIPKQLYLRLQQLADEENTELVSLIERLLDLAWKQHAASLVTPTATVPPIYQLHEYAVDLGVDDLAQNIDHYLYGHDKQ
jgi:hypothetical protein